MKFRARFRTLATVVAPLALLLGTACAHAGPLDCEIGGLAVNPSDGASTAGKTGVMRCREHGSNELLREEQVQGGTFMGSVRIYEKGRLAREHSVNAKGNMQGRAREFAPGGQVLREAVYDDGQERGLVRVFYPGGKLKRVTWYPDAGSERAFAELTERGQLSALRCGDSSVLAPAVDDARLCGFSGGTPSQVELFDARGTLRSRVGYVAGKKVRTQDFYDNGKTAVLDELVGPERTERNFSSEGVKRREVVSRLVERTMLRQREQEFSEKGTLVRDQRWNTAGEPVADDAWFLNGQPRSKSVYARIGNARSVEITEFYDDGQRAAHGSYAVFARNRQVPVGTHQRFDEKGSLIAESSFDAQGRIVRERTWDEHGELERDDEVFPDGSRKAYAR